MGSKRWKSDTVALELGFQSASASFRMPLSVLVVENDPLTRQTIVHMLDSLQYNVHGVDSAALASGFLKSVAFDVMVLSLTFMDPDGDALAMSAKAVQPHLKVIVVSGRYAPEVLKPHVDAFVQKPFGIKSINDAIQHLIAPMNCTTSTP